MVVDGDGVSVVEVPLRIGVVQTPSEYHWYDRGEVPCEP